MAIYITLPHLHTRRACPKPRFEALSSRLDSETRSCAVGTDGVGDQSPQDIVMADPGAGAHHTRICPGINLQRAKTPREGGYRGETLSRCGRRSLAPSPIQDGDMGPLGYQGVEQGGNDG